VIYICDKWVHLKCNLLDSKDYDDLKKSDDPFFCIKCIESNIPFSKLLNNDFVISIINGINGFNSNDTDIEFLLPSQMNTITELNNFINTKINSFANDIESDEDTTSPVNCNYYGIDEFAKANFN
jgi:hypothetical protein